MRKGARIGAPPAGNDGGGGTGLAPGARRIGRSFGGMGRWGDQGEVKTIRAARPVQRRVKPRGPYVILFHSFPQFLRTIGAAGDLRPAHTPCTV